MKNYQTKKMTVRLLATACLVTAGLAALGMQSATANASVTSPYSTLELVEGAAVRIAATKQGIGIKYQMQMSKTEYEELSNYYTDISFGILIAPNDYLSEGHELNAANVFGIGGTQIYGWALPDGNGGWNEYTDTTKVEIVNFSTTTLSPSKEDANVYEFNGSLVNILPANTDRDFCGRGYMLYTENNTKKVEFFGNDENIRSMSYIAQKAIADTSDKALSADDKKKLQQIYVDGIESQATVNYYWQQADGTYEVKDTAKTALQQIGEDVSVATGYETKYVADGYLFNAKKSNVTDMLWANGRTVLNVYYDKVDYSNIAPTAESLNFWRTKNSTNAWSIEGNYGSTQITLTGGENDVYTDGQNVSNKIAQKFDWASKEAQDGGEFVLMAVDMSHLTKATLTALQEAGYQKLSFAFVTHTSSGSVYRGLLNFDWLKADRTRNCGTSNTITKDAYTVTDLTSTLMGYKNSSRHWQTIEYSLSDLVDCYEQLLIDGKYMVLGVARTNYKDAGSFYMTNIELVKGLDLSNLAPTSEYYNFYKTTSATSNWSIDGNYGTTAITLTDVEKTYTDGQNVTKAVSKEFAWEASSTQIRQNVLMAVNMSSYTKEVLTELQEKGYEKLTFSFVNNSGAGVSTYRGLLNFDYLKADSTRTCGSANTINKSAYTVTDLTTALMGYSGSAKHWQTVEYSLADLIACYDQLLIGDYIVLATAGANTKSAGSFYMTNIAII